MSKETSAALASLAARRLDDPDSEVRSLAACVLAQREPNSLMHKAMLEMRRLLLDKGRTVQRADMLALIAKGMGE